MAKQKEEKKKTTGKPSLAETLSSLNKKYGANTIAKFNEMSSIGPVDVIPTGSLGLDVALGVNGYPRGRIVEVMGAFASGKTTFTLHAIAECQRLGLRAAFIDAEHALDPNYAQTLGVNMDELFFSQPNSAEEALEVVEKITSTGEFALVVVDSVAALVPQAELDAEMGKNSIGLQARLMSQAMRKLTAIVNDNNTCLVFINQIRMKIGVLYGSPETTPGGNALAFFASQRLDVRKAEVLKNKDTVYGHTARIKVVKNKVGVPFKEAHVNIIYGKGFDRFSEVFTFGVSSGLIDKAGAWFSYNGEQIGQGAENAKEWFKAHPEAYTLLEKNVYEVLTKSPSALAPSAASEDAEESVDSPVESM